MATKVRTGELGGTGTPIFGSSIYDEYQTDLQGTNGFLIYDRMRRSDSQVSGALDLVKLPIVQAQWAVVPDEGKDGEKVATFCERVLFEHGSYTWPYTVAQALLMLDFGFMPMEKVWELADQGPFADLGVKGETVILKKLSPRMPATITAFNFDEKDGSLLSVTQQLGLSTARTVDLPIEKLAFFVHNKEGDNWMGRSTLRPAYKHWWVKDRLEKIDAIGHERTSLGIPVFTIAEGYMYDPESEEGQLLMERCRTIARNLHANEENYVIEVPGVAFRFETPKGSNRGLLDSMNYHGQAITATVLAQFMNLGQTETGSRAVASEQRGPFDLAILAVAENVASVVNRYVVKLLVDYNFGERDEYPRLEAQGIVESNMGPLATTTSELVKAGLIVPDDDLEVWIREQLDLPPKGKPREQPQEEAPEPPTPVGGKDTAETEEEATEVKEGAATPKKEAEKPGKPTK